jgi:O-acetyl-ADP-ribose deacetylase (regulator of RNase III)
MTIQYTIGDATQPIVGDGVRVIAHVCNDIGKWGAGFSGAVGKAYPDVEAFYRAQWKYKKKTPALGEIQWVFTTLDIAVVNMIAQHRIRDLVNPKPIRYDALEECLEKLVAGCRALEEREDPDKVKVTVHMPRIGCGLAGGSWNAVGALVEDALWDFDVYVYNLPQ